MVSCLLGTTVRYGLHGSTSRLLVPLLSGFILDIQILSFKVSQSVQEEEKPSQGQMDQSLQEILWKGVDKGSSQHSTAELECFISLLLF